METNYDIIVIGSGPGGYSAAIRATQLGFKTALVEKYSTLGGTCTNVGCIPSKALLDSTEHYHLAGSKFKSHGIHTGELKLDFTQLMKRKTEVVKQNTSGLAFLMKKNKIDVLNGTASFVSSTEISITDESGGIKKAGANYFIIATGSKPSSLPGITIDKKRIITSTEALSLNEQPSSLVIIGGGVIGVEMGSVFARIGSRVTILEYADSLIPSMDRDLAKELKKVLSKNGVTTLVSHKVQEVINDGNSVKVKFQNEKDQNGELSADYCIMAVGRIPYTEGLNHESIGIKTNKRGRIEVNEKLQTHVSNIYAIGDVIEGPMLAHKAEEDGVFVAETIAGQKPHLNYHLIPGVVYTWPEVASVGFTEEQLKAEGKTYRVGKFPFAASGRARAAMESDGFVKVVSDPKYGEILGVHVIGPRAADLIAQAVIGMHYETTDEDMYRMSYAHPTYSEAMKEAYMQASGQGSLNL